MSRRTIVTENSPIAPEPTAEEVEKSMVETIADAEENVAEDVIDKVLEKSNDEVTNIKFESVAQVHKALETLEETEFPRKISINGKLYTEAEIAAKLEQANKPVDNLPDSTKPSKAGMMLLANCTLKISKVGSTVPLLRVTPAEVMFLSAEHHAEAGGNPIMKLEILGEVERDNTVEMERLRGKYRLDKLSKMYPGAFPQMPQSFREAVEVGTKTTLPDSKLTEVDLAKV